MKITYTGADVRHFIKGNGFTQRCTTRQNGISTSKATARTETVRLVATTGPDSAAEDTCTFLRKTSMGFVRANMDSNPELAMRM